jgi:ABC-2 type transport system permease protein
VLRQALHQLSFLTAMAKVGFASYLAYPAGVLMVFLSYPIVIMMYRYVFNAVYSEGKELAGYSLTAMITYVTISWILNTFYMTPTGRHLGNRVRDGQVAMDLIKPVNLQGIYFGMSLGRTAFRVVFASLPLLAVFLLFGGVSTPAMHLLPQFILAVACGYLLNFTIDYMIGLLAFFLEYNNGIRWGIRMMMNIAGGMVIPLNYFPDVVARAFSYFPTQFMFYKPLQIYLGRMDSATAWLTVAQSLAWIAGLFILAQIMQRRGALRLSISGG